MSKVDFVKAKADISEIVEIVKTVPDSLQQRCFELLFAIAFSEAKQSTPTPVKLEEPAEEPVRKNEPATGKKLPSNVLAFAHRHSVSRDEISKLFMLDHEPLLPVYQIPTGNVAKAQISKVMMILLENGLLNNAISAPYSELRESLKDEGLFDRNTTGNLKRNHAYFRGAITEESIDENQNVELTGAGMAKLAEIIKELGQ